MISTKTSSNEEIIFVTGNPYKFQTAQNALKEYPIQLIQENLETPEIQSTEVEEVAKYSAKYASHLLQKVVIVSDMGFYIKSLNGFPGPFIKYINKWLSSEDILKLMNDKIDRSIEIRETIALCTAKTEPIAFTSIGKGTIALKKGKTGPTPITEIFIQEGEDKVDSELSKEIMTTFWTKSFNHWEKLANYIMNMK